MGSLWGSIMLLCGVVLLRTEGSGAQQTENNIPRLKLSYKGEFLAFVYSVTNRKSLHVSALHLWFELVFVLMLPLDHVALKPQIACGGPMKKREKLVYSSFSNSEILYM